MPIVIGGVEASLRRIAHYDYWDDRVRPSVLVDSGADLLVYGQGEKPIVEIARRLASGEDVCGLVDVPGTAVAVADLAAGRPGGSGAQDARAPGLRGGRHGQAAFADFSKLYHLEHNHENARILVQRHGRGAAERHVVVNEPMPPPSTEELDAVYELPFVRDAHPSYGGAHIPALEQIRWSVAILRGCAAGCAFCCITEHQGRDVSSRSHGSVIREIETLTQDPKFRGTITDLGGATANMWQMGCTSAEAHAACRRASCVYPTVCRFFAVDHGPLVDLYRDARAVKGVKHAFVGSGLRYDLAHHDRKNGQAYLEELIGHHVSGQLKVAPEHVCDDVLKVMKKPGPAEFEQFRGRVRALLEEGRQGAVPGPVLHLLPPGRHHRARRPAHGVPPEEPLEAAAGAGLHAHAHDAGLRHPVVGLPPHEREAGPRGARHAGEAHPEGAHPLGRSEEPPLIEEALRRATGRLKPGSGSTPGCARPRGGGAGRD